MYLCSLLFVKKYTFSRTVTPDVTNAVWREVIMLLVGEQADPEEGICGVGIHLIALFFFVGSSVVDNEEKTQSFRDVARGIDYQYGLDRMHRQPC